MANSLALIVLLGLTASFIFTKLKLPGFLGMLFVGIVIGPHSLNLIHPDLMTVSADFRSIALIVILLRAGLGISKEKLSSVGGTAIKMSFIPGICEGMTIAYVSTIFFGFTFIQGGILGFIIAAVSPAVVVPLMIKFTEKGYGANKNIPTLILAGASLDDVIAITIFGTFMGLYGGSNINIGRQLVQIPISVILGIGIGLASGILLYKVFTKFHIRDSKKIMIILGISIAITAVESILEGKVAIAGLLGVMTIGFILLEKTPVQAKRLSARFNKIWVLAELLLFTLVGAEVDVTVAIDAGLAGVAIIVIGLVARSIGVFISTIGTDLNRKERQFCAVAYTPKATVQAAIGSIPLAAGVASGDLILAIAVMAIVITAPLGAIAIEKTAFIWLDNSE